MFSRNLWIVCFAAALFLASVDALPMQRFDAYKSKRLARRMVPRGSAETVSPLSRFLKRFHTCKDQVESEDLSVDMELQNLAKDIKAAVVRVEPYIQNLAEQESAYSIGIPANPTTGAWATASAAADDLFVRLERRKAPLPHVNAKRQIFVDSLSSSDAPAVVQAEATPVTAYPTLTFVFTETLVPTLIVEPVVSGSGSAETTFASSKVVYVNPSFSGALDGSSAALSGSGSASMEPSSVVSKHSAASSHASKSSSVSHTKSHSSSTTHVTSKTTSKASSASSSSKASTSSVHSSSSHSAKSSTTTSKASTSSKPVTTSHSKTSSSSKAKSTTRSQTSSSETRSKTTSSETRRQSSSTTKSQTSTSKAAVFHTTSRPAKIVATSSSAASGLSGASVQPSASVSVSASTSAAASASSSTSTSSVYKPTPVPQPDITSYQDVVFDGSSVVKIVVPSASSSLEVDPEGTSIFDDLDMSVGAATATFLKATSTDAVFVQASAVSTGLSSMYSASVALE